MSSDFSLELALFAFASGYISSVTEVPWVERSTVELTAAALHITCSGTGHIWPAPSAAAAGGELRTY